MNFRLQKSLMVLPILALFISATPAQQQSEGEKLIRSNDCSSCHALDRDVVGPAYNSVAKRYAGQADAIDKLSSKIRDGGNGMTPHPDLTDAQRRQIVQWILSQGASSPQSETKVYSYTLKDGTTVQLDFPLFVEGTEGKTQKVTKQVFRGYQLWNSYCFRCHGTDATGGELAPDLRRSLASGMKQKEFLSVAMEGRPERGMPRWAGFLSEDDVASLYKYAKGRSLGLVGGGRPPSEQD